MRLLNLRSLDRSQFTVIIVATIAVLVVVFAGLGAISSRDTVLIPGSTGYTVTNKFAVEGTPPLKKHSVKLAKSLGQEIALWGSWEGDGRYTGKLVSPPFQAPSILSLFISGFFTASAYLDLETPGFPSNRLYVERVDTHEIMQLKVGRSEDRWQELSWMLPMGWWGQAIQMVAIDGTVDPNGWIGVSSPLATHPLSLLKRQLSPLGLILLYGVDAVLFLGLGLPLAGFIIQRQQLHPGLTLMAGIGISTLAGYFTFWAYFLNPKFGEVFSLGLLLGGVISVVVQLRRQGLIGLLGSKDVVYPLLLMLTVGLGYLAVLYGMHFGDRPEFLAQTRFFVDPFPPDNVLPKLLADRLFSGVDPRPLLGDWQSSDRPPLQAGIFLLYRLLSNFTGSDPGLHYQVIGTLAQCSWIAAIWALCCTMRLATRTIAVVMAFCIFSGFFFFHSLFVWPKLLAAALVIFAFTLLLPAVYEARRPSTTELGLAAGATALGMLAHGGVIFTIPAIALMLVRPRIFPGSRQIIVGVVVGLMLLAPWSAYQKLYDPPANRLVKWHLAGISDASDQRSSSQAIFDAYRTAGIAQIAHNKWTNVTELMGSPTAYRNTSNGRRLQEYYFVFQGLGILNVGWLVYFWLLLKRPINLDSFKQKVGHVLGVILISLIFWMLVMFGPAATTIHLGSYATMLLLFTTLAALLAQLPRLIGYALLSFQILKFVIDWVAYTASGFDRMIVVVPNVWLFGLAIACTVGVICVLHQLAQQSPHELLTQPAEATISG